MTLARARKDAKRNKDLKEAASTSSQTKIKWATVFLTPPIFMVSILVKILRRARRVSTLDCRVFREDLARVLAACVSIFAHRVWYFHNLFCVFFSIERCKYRLLISLLLISMN